jgi:hypothetical protein
MRVPHPIPYQGSKRNLAPAILGYFPERVGTRLRLISMASLPTVFWLVLFPTRTGGPFDENLAGSAVGAVWKDWACSRRTQRRNLKCFLAFGRHKRKVSTMSTMEKQFSFTCGTSKRPPSALKPLGHLRIRVAFTALVVAIFLAALPYCFGQQILWEYVNSAPEAGFTTLPAVADDGTVYVGIWSSSASSSGLYAINPNGTEKWKYLQEHAITAGPAIGSNGTVYVATDDGKLHAVKPDGNRKWVFTPANVAYAWGIALAEDDTIYVTANRRGTNQWDNLYAVTSAGSNKWYFPIRTSYLIGGPLLNLDGTILFATYGSFYAVNPDGTKYWDYPVTASEGSAIGSDGTIYLTGSSDVISGGLFALTPEGVLDWVAVGEEVARGSPVVTICGDGSVLSSGVPAKFSFDGIELWGAAGLSSIKPTGSLTVSPEGYYGTGTDITGRTGFVYAVASNGGLFWRTQLHGLPISGVPLSSPALLPDGRMYVTTEGEGARLIAIKVCCGPANTPWLMQAHDAKRTSRAGAGSPAAPALRPIRMAQGRGNQFTLIGELGNRYRIDFSTGLTAWNTWTNILCTNAFTPLTDPAGTNTNYRFYRAAREL